MVIVATLLSLASGFALMGYRETPANLIATSVAVDLSLAPLTAIIASRRGRSATSMGNRRAGTRRVGARRGDDSAGPHSAASTDVAALRLLLMQLDERHRRRENLAL